MNKLIVLVLVILALAFFASAERVAVEKLAEAYIVCAGASPITPFIAFIIAFIAILL